jgi:3'-phosphoadenosine 5'-phosphosulfate sulfotransferase (PAPS reductase)/FAD synthetase
MDWTAPVQIAFSGGRTSGLMLRMILDAHGGKLPDGYYVTFYNTGKEREETLRFVHECSVWWSVPIVWLEYVCRTDETGNHNTYRIVDFESASRNGEPFAALIRQRKYLPNPVMRFCTQELKVNIGKKFMLDRGYKHWTCVIGIRADEEHRARATRMDRADRVYPLVGAGMTEDDVMAFWAKQPFDLGLRRDEGNCDLCFLKGRRKLAQLVKDRPCSAGWWDQQEKWVSLTIGQDRSIASFRKEFSYQDLIDHHAGGPMFSDADEMESCSCTD